jgi:hypothetical protein
MFEPCTCGTGGKNTGVPSCVPTIERVAMMIMMQTFADDGSRNSIKKSDFVNGVLPDAFIQAKINEVDPSKRWYVTPKINSVTDVRAEPVTFDVDGISIFVSQGNRTFLGSFYSKFGTPQFAGVLNSFQCITISYYEISEEGAIVGIDNGDEMLPIDIEDGTLYSGVVKGTKTDPNSVTLTFVVQELVRDENLIQISSANIGGNMLLKKGLIDGTGSALALPAITTTTARLDLNYTYGEFPNKLPFKGLVVADLSPDNGTTTSAVYNNSTSSNVVVTSLVPVPGEDGVYDMTLAVAQSSTNEISVDLFKAGFDFEAFTYLIP